MAFDGPCRNHFRVVSTRRPVCIGSIHVKFTYLALRHLHIINVRFSERSRRIIPPVCNLEDGATGDAPIDWPARPAEIICSLLNSPHNRVNRVDLGPPTPR